MRKRTLYLSVLFLATAVLLGRPTSAAETWSRLHLLTAEDGAAADAFGQSVSISGERAIIGAPQVDELAPNAGAAYIFDVANGTQLNKFLASDGIENDRFGAAVGIDGDLAAIGACCREGLIGGFGYIFDVNAGQELYKLNSFQRNNQMGETIAIYGVNVVTGADDDAALGAAAGAAFVWDASPGQRGEPEWIFKLAGTDTEADDIFGTSVDIGETQLIVGAPGDAGPANESGRSVGAAWIFDIQSGQSVRKLSPSNPAEGDRFGAAVAMSGNLAVIGAPLIDDPDRRNVGKAFIYDVETGEELHSLQPADLLANDRFGASVAIDGDRVIVGSSNHDEGARDAGAAYIFDATTGEQLAKLVPENPERGDRFGNDVAIGGDYALVGVAADDELGSASGSVYVFARPSNRFVRQPGDANEDRQFDTADIVQVLASNKFETGQPATWGEGDWNAAPDESISDAAPVGDGVFSTTDVVAALAANLFETGPYAGELGSNPGDGQVAVVYNAATGEVAAESTTPLSSFQVESASGIFSGDNAKNLGGPFDVDTDTKVFKATFGDRFESLSFGTIASAGLSEAFLLEDLAVTGSFAEGGTFGPDVELQYIPEPSGLVLLLVGVIAAAGLRRRFA